MTVFPKFFTIQSYYPNFVYVRTFIMISFFNRTLSIKIMIIFTISAAMFTVNPLQFAILFGYVLSGCLIAHLPFARYKKELRFFLLLLVIIIISRWISSNNLLPSLCYGRRFYLCSSIQYMGKFNGYMGQLFYRRKISYGSP